MRTEDGSIIQECLDGRSGAFGVLVDKYKEGIYAFVYTRLQDFQDAQDVTQEVFLRAYRDLRSLRRWESFAFWLYRIAYARCAEWLKLRSKRADRDFMDDQNPEVINALSLDSYRVNQLSESVREALNSLPEIHREVLVLRYFGDMNSRGMARALGASPTAIRKRLSRARAQLREEMIAMMDTAFEGQRLRVGFTLRIVEAIKRANILPMPRVAGLPWGLSLAMGVIITVLSVNPHPMSGTTGSPVPVETKVLKSGEIPVDILKTGEIYVIASKQEDSDGGSPQNTFMLSPQQDEGGTSRNRASMPLGGMAFAASAVQADQRERSENIIVPGIRVGDFTFDMTRDDVLRRLGKPVAIFYGDKKYTLNNLPRTYYMGFDDISFLIRDGWVREIGVLSVLYKFTNGLGVGSSEQRVKEIFGEDFRLKEGKNKDFLAYEDGGLEFEISRTRRTVVEMNIYTGQRGIIVPGLRVGNYWLGMTKDDVLRRIGNPMSISYEGKNYTLEDLPGTYYLNFDDISLLIRDGSVREISVHGPLYEFTDGLGVGSSEQEVKETLGKDFRLVKGKNSDRLVYENEGVTFEIDRARRTVIQVGVIAVPRQAVDLHEDLRGVVLEMKRKDLIQLDLRNADLAKTTFDSFTQWPASERLPEGFDPDKVMEWGKYPGLGVKQLHDQGITGKGVHVAIIDQPLLLDHMEYRDQLASYTEIQTGDPGPQMHGPAVASLLVGKTCGVAPEAILHFWAEPSWKRDYQYRCTALEQIIQYNKGKEKSEQIRIVSVSKGFSHDEPNLDRWKELLKEARRNGIYVIHCGEMSGAGCPVFKDSDEPSNYKYLTKLVFRVEIGELCCSPSF
jgi:RNA polymerase sigma factor (sigma-70 family)